MPSNFLKSLLDKVRYSVISVLSSYGLIEEESGGEYEELILLTHKMCPHCISLKEKIHNIIERGQIREVYVNSEEGKKIAKLLNIHEVPTLVAKVGDTYIKCDYWLDDDGFAFDLNGKTYFLPYDDSEYAEAEGVSVRELLVLTSTNCIECVRLKQAISDGLERGIFKEVNVDFDEFGKRLMEVLGVRKLPQIVAVLDDGTHVLCKYEYEDEGISFELTNVMVSEEDIMVDPFREIETLSEDYPEGTLAISCMDTYLKNDLAQLILDKYEEKGGDVTDNWYQLNVAMPLLSIPECPESQIGFGKVIKKRRKRKSKRRTKKIKDIGIVALCKEAKEFLAEYDKRVLELKECDLIEFAPVVGVKKLTPYQEFMKKCLAEHKKLPNRERFSICAKKWRESKSLD